MYLKISSRFSAFVVAIVAALLTQQPAQANLVVVVKDNASSTVPGMQKLLGFDPVTTDHFGDPLVDPVWAYTIGHNGGVEAIESPGDFPVPDQVDFSPIPSDKVFEYVSAGKGWRGRGFPGLIETLPTNFYDEVQGAPFVSSQTLATLLPPVGEVGGDIQNVRVIDESQVLLAHPGPTVFSGPGVLPGSPAYNPDLLGSNSEYGVRNFILAGQPIQLTVNDFFVEEAAYCGCENPFIPVIDSVIALYKLQEDGSFESVMSDIEYNRAGLDWVIDEPGDAARYDFKWL